MKAFLAKDETLSGIGLALALAAILIVTFSGQRSWILIGGALGVAALVLIAADSLRRAPSGQSQVSTAEQEEARQPAAPPDDVAETARSGLAQEERRTVHIEKSGAHTESTEFAFAPPSPLLIVISGPSGVGKDAVLEKMKKGAEGFHFVVTATTRPQRPGEVSGRDYLFLSPEEFQEMIARDALLEWAQVYGYLYGVPKDPVRQALSHGKDVVIKADVQGAATIRGLAPEGVFIFLAPPSWEELEQRLRGRRTESATALARRLETARQEMATLPHFDYLVVNQEARLDEAVASIRAIITAEKCRVKPRRVEI